MKYMTVLMLLVLFGCSPESPTNPDTTNPVTESEYFVLAETARFAGILGANVRGELTDYFYPVACADGTKGCHAFGWYHKGVAYFYRPEVNRQSRYTLSDAAAHEVCHSVSLFHDAALYACFDKIRNQ